MTNDSNQTERRSFLARGLAGLVGLLAGLVPVASGLLVFLDPLARKSKAGQFVRITSLDAVPADGVPRRFPVIAERSDAWNQYPPEAIGSIYLRRTDESSAPEAFSSVCPHLGCSVDFRPARGEYLCPCHNSAFEVDGSRVNPQTSPSPRDLDTLPVEIRDENEVWVDYRRFVSGKSEKIEE